MRTLTPTLAVLLLLPSLVFAQLEMPDIKFKKSEEPKPDRIERKAERIAEKDKDFAKLTEAEQDVVIRTIAKKLRQIKAYNSQLKHKRRQKLKSVNIQFTVEDSDLEEFYERHPSLKNRFKIREKETITPGQTIVDSTPPKIEDVMIKGGPFHDLFEDNEWEVVEGSCEADELRAQVDDAVAQAGPDGKVTGLIIQSSASTLRNTGKAAKLSFLQLSQKRAEAARDFVIKYFKDKHGRELLPQDAELDYEGENGDGTSGPRGPYANDGEGNGEPAYKDVDEYAQHKFVSVTIQVVKPVLIEEGKTVTQEIPGEEESEVVTMTMSTSSRCRWWRCWRFPKLEFKHRNRGKIKPYLVCPKVRRSKGIPGL